MGLDMSVYHYKKIKNLKDKNTHSSFWLKADADDFVLGKSWLEGTYLGDYNDKIFRKDLFLEKHGFDFEDSDHMTIASEGVIEWFKEDGETLLRLTSEEYNSFFDDNVINAYFFNSDEIAYQRKGICEEGWKILNEIGSCVPSRDLDKFKNL